MTKMTDDRSRRRAGMGVCARLLASGISVLGSSAAGCADVLDIPSDPHLVVERSPALGISGGGAPDAHDALGDGGNSLAPEPSRGAEAVDVPARVPVEGAATPLVLLDSVPPAGAMGIAPDTELQLVFNRSLDPESLVVALRGDGPAPELVGVRWSSDGTRVTFVPAEPLALATGTDPDQVVPLQYELVVGAARDASGASLPETRISFSTLRRIQVSLPALPDANATGNFRSDGAYGDLDCAASGDVICIGESLVASGELYVGFVSFALDALLVGEPRLESARLLFTLSELDGDPFANLGPLQLERVQYSSIGPAAFSTPALATDGLLSTAPVGGAISFDLVEALTQILAGSQELAVPSDLAQFRLRFAQSTVAASGRLDLLQLARSDARLDVTYLLP
ncbi:MAG: Ig-like domain-containing protein [Deltaproteobacteria bacterium]